jgi:hypothetical protein
MPTFPAPAFPSADEGVDERVEEVLVRVAAILQDGSGRREERVAEAHLGLVARVGEVGVHVAEQRRPRALQVLRDGAHVPLREAALRRRDPARRWPARS